MSVAERLALASITANLGDSALRVTDSDVLKAAGMVGQHKPELALGLALVRLTQNHDTSQLRACVEPLAQRLRRQRGTEDALLTVARVLRYLCDDRCEACHGRKFDSIEGTPYLSDVACGACAGSGRKELDGDDERWLIDVIVSEEQAALAAIVEKLR